MDTVYFKPYKTDIENNPGVELFVWRISVFCVFFVLLILLLTISFAAMSFVKKGATFLSCLILLYMIFYHLRLALVTKKMRYDITENSLIIRSIAVHERIKLTDIKELVEVKQEALVVKKRKVLSYLKVAPQIVYPVAQVGVCVLEGFGAVTFYSFVDSLKEPKNLIFISTRENKRYAISPTLKDDFIALIRQSQSA